LKCPKCKKENDKAYRFCSYCGASLRKKETVRTSRVIRSIRDNNIKGSGARFVDFTSKFLRLLPFRKRISEYLELDKMKRLQTWQLAAPMLLTFIMGLLKTKHGHIENTPFLYQLMPIISCFNPFLGFLSAMGFSIGDFLQKMVIDDVYYESAKTMGDYIGARAGYLLAYSSVFLYGLLPGIMARIFRRLVSRSVGSSNLSIPGIDSLTSITGRNFGSFVGNNEAIDPMNASGIGLNTGTTVTSNLLSIIAFAAGGAVGSAIAGVAAIGLELPAFYLRPNFDVSCAKVMVNNVKNIIPSSTATGGIGGGATTLLNPFEQTKEPPERPKQPPESEKPSERPEEEEKQEEEKEEESDYRLRLTTNKNKIKGDGKDSLTVTAEIIGKDGSSHQGDFIFDWNPKDAANLSSSGSQATIISKPLMKSKSVTITCTATIKGRESWFGIMTQPGVTIGPKEVTVKVIGANPILKLVPKSTTLKGDGKLDSCTIINYLFYLYEEEELLPEEIAWDLLEYLVTGKIHKIQGQAIKFCPGFSMKDGNVTITARVDVKLPSPLPTVHLDPSVTFNIRGANPEFKLIATPEKIFGDGKEFSVIKGECTLFGELEEIAVNFLPHDKGIFDIINIQSAKFTPQYTAKDEIIRLIANVSLGPPTKPQLKEESVAVEIIGADLTLAISPDEVDGDEVSKAEIKVEPEKTADKLDIDLRMEPDDAGKLASSSPPTSFTPFLAEKDEDISIVAIIKSSGKIVLEKRKTIHIRGANPSIQLEAPESSIRGDGKTRTRINAKITLYGKQATESRLNQLNASIEWREKSQEDGSFVVKQKTYAEYTANPTFKDKETTVTAKIILTSKETGLVIEKESDPLILRIEGAKPELKLRASPTVLPGTPYINQAKDEVKGEIKADLLVFGEEKEIPQGKEAQFQLITKTLGRLEKHQVPNICIIKPSFIARDKDTNTNVQTLVIETKLNLKTSDLFPNAANVKDETIELDKKIEIKLTGCLVEILEPKENSGFQSKDGKLFDIKARITTQNGNIVPGQSIRFLTQDMTKTPAVASQKLATTNNIGEAITNFIFIDQDKSKPGKIQIRAEIRGANNTLDYDTITVNISKKAETIKLDLRAKPMELPGARMLEDNKPVKSLIEAKLVGSKGEHNIPSGKAVEFELIDQEMGALEEKKPTSVVFRPNFIVRDLDNGVVDYRTTIKGQVELSRNQVEMIQPGSSTFQGESALYQDSEELKIDGCLVKIIEPKEGDKFIALDGKLFDIKAKVQTPSKGGEGVPGIEVKFTITDGTKKGSDPLEKKINTDRKGEALHEYIFEKSENSEDGDITIKAEVYGAKSTQDWDEIKVQVKTGLSIQIKATMSRVVGEYSEKFSKHAMENYEAIRLIELKEEEE
jgi:hypothetical protein